MKAIDALGQEIAVGDTVAWGAGGRYGFGVGIGKVTELVPREVFVGWEVEPVYEMNEQGRRGRRISDGVRRMEVRAYCKVKSLLKRRQGKSRADDDFVKVIVPGLVESQQ